MSLLVQLEEDARALAEFLVRKEPLPPSHIRVAASAVVRKWLVDNQLSQLARETGSVLELPALDTQHIEDAIRAGAPVTFFVAGGVALDGEPLRGLYVSDAQYAGSPPIPIDQMTWIDVSPKAFLRLRRVYHNGEWFSVEQVIRFVANKYGGVHFDATREKEWQHRLERAAAFFGVGNPQGLNERQIVETRSPDHKILLVLPREKGHVWTCLDIELLAVAQSLVNVRCNGQPLFTFVPGTS